MGNTWNTMEQGSQMRRSSKPNYFIICQIRIKRCVPIPASMSKILMSFLRPKIRHNCWFDTYFWSEPAGLQSNVNNVFSGSPTDNLCPVRFFTTFAPPELRAALISISISTIWPGRTMWCFECAASIFSVIIVKKMF